MIDFRASQEKFDVPSRPLRPRRLFVLLAGGVAVTALAVALTSTATPSRTPDAARGAGQADRVAVALTLPGQALADTDSSAALITELPSAPPAQAAAENAAVSAPVQVATATEPEAIATGDPVVTAPPAPAGDWRADTVRSGDTLSAIFKRLGLSQTTLHQLLQADGLDRELQRLRPGDEVRVRVDGSELLELAYAADALATLHVTLDDRGWSAATVATPAEVRTRFVGGIIEDSLYLSALEAGLNDRLIMELAAIFGWDVDFALDIRAGDRFGLIQEELYAEDGSKLADGAILAASFTNQGKSFHAVRFTDPSGYASYFTPDGFSMRKAFLRSPVDFRRISSRFRGSRYHPVLGVKRPHKGVDYAAATGTPVKAAGDGKVVHLARKGGYGKTVILQHGGRYRTLYAHLSKYARGLKNGQRVRQGQTIGHVGATGLATGPHLHYEFLVDGVHRNPLTVDLPKADPIDPKLLPDFRTAAAPLLAQLATHEQMLVAQNRE